MQFHIPRNVIHGIKKRFGNSLNTQNFVTITEENVKEVLCYKKLVPVIEKAFSDFSKCDGGITQPVRVKFPAEKNSSGNYYVMPCSYNGVLVTKLITQFPQNNPRIQSVLTVHDAKEGSMKALLESNLLTAARTAAMSAVATKYLAPTNSKVLAILGAGVQAKSHYFALQSVKEFEEVRIWNRNYLKAETLAQQIGCRACESAEDAVRGADVITTVTGSDTPVLKYEWVTNGAHINCVGGNRPSWQELDPKLMQNAIVYTDTIESAMEESGDIILSKCKIYAEIGDLVNRTKPVKRDQTTVFKSLGMAAMDAAAAKLIYETYTAEQLQF